jgi:hypothetical protein
MHGVEWAEDVSAAGVIRIEMRLDGSMPSGQAFGADGATEAFTGWVGLMSAVDTLSGVKAAEADQEGER